MIYLDANVFLYNAMLEAKSSELASSSKEILIAAGEGRINAATASLTWDEIFWTVKKQLGRELAAKESAKFLEFPNLKILKVDESTIRKAQLVVESYGMNPRDAIHVACCMENGIDRIISNDTDFDVMKLIKRIGPKEWKTLL